jgi:hypothetical protein
VVQTSSEWSVGNLRVTLFPVGVNAPNLGNYQQMVGVPPDTVSQQPKLNSAEETGEFGKGVLSFKIVPGRVDWVYQPVISEKNLPESIPNVGLFAEAIDIFLPLVTKWIAPCTSAIRIAFGASLFLDAENHEDAYQLLSKYLHSVRIDANSSELFYQINRPRPSANEGLRINRLSKWKALKLSTIINNVQARESFACSLELDINNIPDEKRMIQKNETNTLLREFLSLSEEIMKEGDIA